MAERNMSVPMMTSVAVMMSTVAKETSPLREKVVAPDEKMRRKFVSIG